MKPRLSVLMTTIVSLALLASAQSTKQIIGIWQGENRGKPWVTLNVLRDHNGQLSGTAVFYVLDRTQNEEQPKVIGKQEVALVDPKMAGNVLSFTVKNHQAEVTMNQFLGEDLQFKMVVHNEIEATLTSENRDSLSVKMVKQK